MAGISTQTLIFAAAGGVLPTFLWLWFWLTKEDDRPEPFGLVALAFLGGALGVLVLMPLKPYVESLGLDANHIIVLYAALEELVKFAIVGLIVFGSSYLDQAIDYTIYLVTGALGFSALENTLYLITPIHQGLDIGAIVVTGNLRFLGATVLHTITVALVGVLLGLAFALNNFWKLLHVIIGLALAIGLHTAFNYFIMQNTRQGTMIAIAGIWFVAVIVILLFDRLRAYRAAVA